MPRSAKTWGIMKVTLPDLFWVLLVCAICTAWWVDHRQQSSALDTDVRRHKWYFEVLAGVLEKENGLKASVDRDGVTIRYPNGDVHVDVTPDHLRSARQGNGP